MPTKGHQSSDTFLDRFAIAITAVLLGGIFIGLQRFAAGSWRNLGAAVVALTIYGGGAVLVDRWLRRTGRLAAGRPAPRWFAAVSAVLGALARLVHGIVAVGSPSAKSALWGAVMAGMLVLFSILTSGRARADASQPPSA